MSQALYTYTYTYTPPHATDGNDVPAGLVGYLDSHDLLTGTQTVRLSTVDPDGWPHAALLSAGDAVMLPAGRLRSLAHDGSLRHRLGRAGNAPWYGYTLSDHDFVFEPEPAGVLSSHDPRQLKP
ncbi:MAG: hypothetical protein JO352_06515 [Chloroflexi bacterium]|nr:hypothetical protein [Chloroflexota bacterium]MBV9601294.1 hypothetical protein [Chloroflexota bacterium]